MNKLSIEQQNKLMEENQKFYPEDFVVLLEPLTKKGVELSTDTKWEVIDNFVEDDEIVYECRSLKGDVSYKFPQRLLKRTTKPRIKPKLKDLPLKKKDRVLAIGSWQKGQEGIITKICDVNNGYDYMVQFENGTSGMYARDIQKLG